MKPLLPRLEALLAEGHQLREDWKVVDGGTDDARQLRALRTARWVQSCEHWFDFAGLAAFKQKFSDTQGNRSYPAYQFAQLVGILESAKDEISAGFVGRLVYLVHADFFGSTIEQASELARSGHLIPAAVLGRIVIETWLRDEAERHSIPEHDSAKASVINERLKTAGVFSTPRWRLIQGYLDVGNSAAHGKADEFTAADVEQLLAFTKAHCI